MNTPETNETTTTAAVAEQETPKAEKPANKKAAKKGSKKPAAKKEAKPASKKAAKAAPKKDAKPAAKKAAKAKDAAAKPREGSKKQIVIDLLSRKDGATMAEIAAATGWQNHSIRGFISGTLMKKMELPVASLKNDRGERQYQIEK